MAACYCGDVHSEQYARINSCALYLTQNTRKVNCLCTFYQWKNFKLCHLSRFLAISRRNDDQIRVLHVFKTRALYYKRFCDTSQEFQPMVSQLSKKAALPLAKILATSRNNVSNTGPCTRRINNTWRPRQNGRHFRRRHFQMHCYEWKILYFI